MTGRPNSVVKLAGCRYPNLVGEFGCHEFYFSIYWECHHPNWLIFFRGVAQPPTRNWLVSFNAFQMHRSLITHVLHVHPLIGTPNQETFATCIHGSNPINVGVLSEIGPKQSKTNWEDFNQQRHGEGLVAKNLAINVAGTHNEYTTVPSIYAKHHPLCYWWIVSGPGHVQPLRFLFLWCRTSWWSLTFKFRLHCKQWCLSKWKMLWKSVELD